jgi:hypothetical protein
MPEQPKLVFSKAFRITKNPDSHEPLTYWGGRIVGNQEVPLRKSYLRDGFYLLEDGFLIGASDDLANAEYTPIDLNPKTFYMDWQGLMNDASRKAEELSALVDMNFEGIIERETDVLLLRPVHARSSDEQYLCQMIERYEL